MTILTPSVVPEHMYTSEEVSEFLRLSLRTVQRLLQNKTLPAYKIHGQYRIKGLDLLAYLDTVRQDGQSPVADSSPVALASLLQVLPLCIEFGQDWLPWVQAEAEVETDAEYFLPRLKPFRKQMILRLGLILPGIQLNDNLELAPNAYRLLLHGIPLLEERLDPQGRYRHEPKPADGDEALAYGVGYAPDADGELSGMDLLFLQLEEVLMRHAYEILSRDEVAVILEQLRQSRPAVLEEVLAPLGSSPEDPRLTLGQLTRILRRLLQEQVSIRNLGLILEILADHAGEKVDLSALTECVRQGLARQINAPLLRGGVLHVVALDPQLEERIKALVLEAPESPLAQNWVRPLQAALNQVPEARVLLCSAELRRKLFEVLQGKCPHLRVLAYQEVARENKVRVEQTLSFDF